MSELRNRLQTPEGRNAVLTAMELTAGLVSSFPGGDSRPSIVMEVCLVEQGELLTSYQRQTLWGSHQAGGTEQAELTQEQYSRELTATGKISLRQLHYNNAGHYIINLDGEQYRVLVIVAGAHAAMCRMLARHTVAGIVAAIAAL